MIERLSTWLEPVVDLSGRHNFSSAPVDSKAWGSQAWTPVIAGRALQVLALTTLVGWIAGWSWLTNWGASLASMRPITALCFLAAGSALAGEAIVNRRVAAGLGWAICAAGVLSLVVIFAGPASANVMRMSQATAIGFILAGVAVASRHHPNYAQAVPFLAGAIVIIAAIALLGYAYGSSDLYALPLFGSLSLPTGAGFLVLAVGLLADPGTRWPEVSLRTALGVLVAGALLPAVVFIAMQSRKAELERAGVIEAAGRELTRSLADAADRKIGERTALLRGLVTSPALKSGDFATFYEQASVAVGADEGWIDVADWDGRQLINTLVPFGTALPAAATTSVMQKAADTGLAQVSDVFIGAVAAGRQLVSVSYPVAGTEWIVNWRMPIDVFLQDTKSLSPEGWILALADRQGLIIARSKDNDKWAGKPAAASAWQMAQQSPSGWSRATTLEGLPVQFGWRQLPSGWVALVGLDDTIVRKAEQALATRLTQGMLVAALLGLLVALLAAAAIGRPLLRLADAADAFGRGEVPASEPSNVREIGFVRAALTKAAELRVATERALLEREALLRSATSNASVGLVMVDIGRRYSFANPAYTRILGLKFSPEELIGKGPAEVLPGVYATQIAPNLDRAFAGERCTFELAKQRAGGECGTYVVVYEPQRDGAGTVAAVIVTIFDITDRKRAEDELRESEERFRKIFENAATGIVIADWHGQVQQCNPAYCALLGFTQAELCQDEFVTRVHPDDRAVNLANIERLKAGETQSFELENRYVDKNGQPVWVHKFVSILRDETGRPAYIVALVTNVTERKRSERALRESEARFAATVQTAADAIIVINERGLVQSINPATERMFGYNANEVIGNNVSLLMPEPHHSAHDGYLAAFCRTGQAKVIGSGREVDGRRKDGSTFPADLSVAEWRVGDQRYFTGIMRDITVRKEHESHVRLIMRELSHRTKNALAVAQAMAWQTARSTTDVDEFQERFSQRIDGLSRSIGLLVRGDWEGVKLHDLLMEQLAPFLDAAARLTCEGPPLVLHPNGAQDLGLVVHELATNASKYGALSAPDGRIVITWTIRTSDQPVLQLDWQEIGGPLIEPPVRCGFGTTVIRDMLARTYKAKTELDFKASGFTWRLEIAAGRIVRETAC
ncbi:MAG: PAS domain S-box protein [Hyphomicrobiaceae bacterium]